MAAKRQLLLELLAKDSTEQATRGASENLDNVAESAEGAAKATDNLGEQASESSEKVERFGRSNKTAAEHSEKLKREIDAVEHELHQLAVAFAEAETAADRADFSKAIRKTQGDLKKLNKGKSLVDDLVPDSTSLGKKLSESFSGAGEIVGPALGIAAAASAPFIGAAISGAIVGGVGIGGIAGGLILAAKDPRVSSALDAFKKETGDRLKDAAAPFVPVALDGIHKIDAAFKGINFEGLFADAAKEAGPLIHGVISLVSDLGSAFTDLVHNAGPEVAAIGDGIGDLGHALEGGLESLADNGAQGAQALSALFGTISVGTEVVFGLINVLTETYGWLEKIHAVSIFDLFGKITEYQHDQALGSQSVAAAAVQAAEGAQSASNATDRFGHSILTAGDAIESFTTEVDRLADAGHSLFDSTTQVGEAIDRVAEAAKHSKAGLDANTEAGRNNRQALSTLASALVANYDAYVKVNGEGVKSNTIAGQNREQFVKLATAFTGSRGAAEKLATQMGLIPAKKNTDFTANTHDAAARIKALQEQVNRLKGKTINVRAVVTASVSDKVSNTLARFEPRAEGGPVKKGKAYVVGEHRAEAFVPDRDGTIIPSLDQFSGAGSPAGGPVGGTVTHRVVVEFAGRADQFGALFLNMLRTSPAVRTEAARILAKAG